MDTRFQWDYPTQGLRHPRSMAEAFGPYATLTSSPPRGLRLRRAAIIPAMLCLAGVLLFIFGA